jgi:hypothetical protein
VWSHPFIMGELACGTLARRREILSYLDALPHAPLVDHDEVRRPCAPRISAFVILNCGRPSPDLDTPRSNLLVAGA